MSCLDWFEVIFSLRILPISMEKNHQFGRKRCFSLVLSIKQANLRQEFLDELCGFFDFIGRTDSRILHPSF